MGTWNDRKKFWSETSRTILLACLGVLCVYFIVDPLKNETLYEAELNKERIALKSALIDNFLSKGHQYAAIAFDALNGDPSSITLYQNEAGDNYNDLVNRMSLYFSENHQIQMELLEMRSTDSLLYQCFKNKMQKNEWDPIRKKLKQQQISIAKKALSAIGF